MLRVDGPKLASTKWANIEARCLPVTHQQGHRLLFYRHFRAHGTGDAAG
jgi:hypothetical protein